MIPVLGAQIISPASTGIHADRVMIWLRALV